MKELSDGEFYGLVFIHSTLKVDGGYRMAFGICDWCKDKLQMQDVIMLRGSGCIENDLKFLPKTHTTAAVVGCYSVYHPLMENIEVFVLNPKYTQEWYNFYTDYQTKYNDCAAIE